MKEQTKQQIKQLPVYLGLLALVIAVLVWIGNSSVSEKPTAAIGEVTGALTFDKSQYDFGTISMAKGKVSKEFILENKTQGDIRIGDTYTSCMCTEVELKAGNKVLGPFGMQGHGLSSGINLTVKPGEKLIAKVVFDPSAHGPSGVGPIERQVAINTSAGSEPAILNFKAIVTP